MNDYSKSYPSKSYSLKSRVLVGENRFSVGLFILTPWNRDNHVNFASTKSHWVNKHTSSSRGPTQRKLNSIFKGAFVSIMFCPDILFNLTGLSFIYIVFSSCMFLWDCVCECVSVNCVRSLWFFGSFFSACLSVLFWFVWFYFIPSYYFSSCLFSNEGE